MPARWLQQKIVKQKRMRRAWAKPFSMKNTGPNMHPGFVTGSGKNKGFTDIGPGARSKAASSMPDYDTLSKFLVSKFKYNDAEAIYARTRGLHSDLAVDREIILAKLVQSRGNAGSLQGERRYVYQEMYTGHPNYKLRLYISGEKCFFICEIKTNTHFVYKRSYEIEGLQFAVETHRRDRILWESIERIPLPADQIGQG